MAEQILVVILSSALALFLVLGIVLLVICIKIANNVRHVTEKVETITDKAEDIADFFSKAAPHLSIARAVTSVVDSIMNKKHK